jgi:hypothetical protein
MRRTCNPVCKWHVVFWCLISATVTSCARQVYKLNCMNAKHEDISIIHIARLWQECCNSKSMIFQEKLLKVFKCYKSMSATTTQLLSSSEFCKLRYDTIPVKSASADVSFYTSNSKKPNFELWQSCCRWAICTLCGQNDVSSKWDPRGSMTKNSKTLITKNFCVLHIQLNTTIFHLVVQ